MPRRLLIRSVSPRSRRRLRSCSRGRTSCLPRSRRTAHDEAVARTHFEQAAALRRRVDDLEQKIRLAAGCSGGRGDASAVFGVVAFPRGGVGRADGPVFSRAVLSCQHEGETRHRWNSDRRLIADDRLLDDEGVGATQSVTVHTYATDPDVADAWAVQRVPRVKGEWVVGAVEADILNLDSSQVLVTVVDPHPTIDALLIKVHTLGVDAEAVQGDENVSVAVLIGLTPGALDHEDLAPLVGDLIGERDVGVQRGARDLRGACGVGWGAEGERQAYGQARGAADLECSLEHVVPPEWVRARFLCVRYSWFTAGVGDRKGSRCRERGGPCGRGRDSLRRTLNGRRGHRASLSSLCHRRAGAQD